MSASTKTQSLLSYSFLSYKTISHQRQRHNCFKFCRSVFWHCWLDDGVGVSPVEILHQCTTKVLWKTYVWPGFSWSGVFSRKIGQLNKNWKENCSYLISHSSVVVFTFMKSCYRSYSLCVFVHFRATYCSFVNMRCSFLWHSLWVLERTCLGGSCDWVTVRTDWNGLSEELGFNSPRWPVNFLFGFQGRMRLISLAGKERSAVSCIICDHWLILS